MIVAIIIVLFILVVISMYNSLVRKRNQIENAFSTIDVMLKRRFDLIPNLVATVQQYAKHEADTFAAITEMRNKTYTSLNDSEKADFDKMFSKDINIIPCPVNDSFTTKENWYKTPAGYERAIGEIFGIIDYANKGYINNFNITL